MPYTSFHLHFREIAEKETRMMTIIREDDVIPKGSYGLLEMYCDDPGCDCRRVFFEVYDWERRTSLAYIAYGWESADFYRKWWKGNDSNVIRELQGPILNDGSPQSKYAPAFLRLVKDVVLSDPAYVERLKRHYQIFKEKVDPKHFRKTEAAKRAVVEKPKSKKRKRH
ncbi:MAG: hypothetical protein ACOYYU_08215 [Chloroflexota bacterium]